MMSGHPLPVMEMFYTLQGEGHYQGVPAYFIRLAGCDVGCVWCDVKESWDKDKYPLQTVEHIVEQARASGADIAVITGGEPAMYALTALTTQLHQAGIRTHIETSGVYALSGTWDWVCYSPKKFKKPHPTTGGQAHELKVVVCNKHDLAWAEAQARDVGKDCLLYLQPEWGKRDQVLPMIIAYIKDHPRWKLSAQLHKYIGIP